MSEAPLPKVNLVMSPHSYYDGAPTAERINALGSTVVAMEQPGVPADMAARQQEILDRREPIGEENPASRPFYAAVRDRLPADTRLTSYDIGFEHPEYNALMKILDKRIYLEEIATDQSTRTPELMGHMDGIMRELARTGKIRESVSADQIDAIARSHVFAPGENMAVAGGLAHAPGLQKILSDKGYETELQVVGLAYDLPELKIMNILHADETAELPEDLLTREVLASVYAGYEMFLPGGKRDPQDDPIRAHLLGQQVVYGLTDEEVNGVLAGIDSIKGSSQDQQMANTHITRMLHEVGTYSLGKMLVQGAAEQLVQHAQ